MVAAMVSPKNRAGAAIVAARAILGRGERLTYESLGAECGLNYKQAYQRVVYLRRQGRWEFHVERDEAVPKYHGPGLRPLSPTEEAILSHGKWLAEDGRVDLDDLADLVKLNKTDLSSRLEFLRNRGLWSYRAARGGCKPRLRPAREPGPPPMTHDEVLAAAEKVRDTKETRRLRPAIRGESQPKTLAEECRGYFRQWRSVTEAHAGTDWQSLIPQEESQ
jgi:hypothetical protein